MELSFGTYQQRLVGGEGCLYCLDAIAGEGGELRLDRLVDIPFGVDEGLEPVGILSTPDVLREEGLGERQLLRLREACIVVGRPACHEPWVVAVGGDGKQVRRVADVVVGQCEGGIGTRDAVEGLPVA